MRSTRLEPGRWSRLDLAPNESFVVRTLVDRQAVELVAHEAADPRIRLSTLLTALAENVHQPRAGTRFWSQEYTPLFQLTEQSIAQHDMFLEACNPALNAALTSSVRSGSCWENFRDGLEGLGLSEKWIPYPLGIFREASEIDGRFQLQQSPSSSGDSVRFIAENAIVLIASACPLSAPPLAVEGPTVEIEWGDQDEPA